MFDNELINKPVTRIEGSSSHSEMADSCLLSLSPDPGHPAQVAAVGLYPDIARHGAGHGSPGRAWRTHAFQHLRFNQGGLRGKQPVHSHTVGPKLGRAILCCHHLQSLTF